MTWNAASTSLRRWVSFFLTYSMCMGVWHCYYKSKKWDGEEGKYLSAVSLVKLSVCCRYWLQCTRPCQTTMCTWKALSWNPTWSPLDTAAPPSTAQRRLLWQLSPPCAALSPQLSQVTQSAVLSGEDFILRKYVWHLQQENESKIIFVCPPQEWLFCQAVRVKKRPLSTSMPSTTALWPNPGS